MEDNSDIRLVSEGNAESRRAGIEAERLWQERQSVDQQKRANDLAEQQAYELKRANDLATTNQKIALVSLVFIVLTCIGAYLAVPQAQTIIQSFQHEAAATLTPISVTPTTTPR